MSPSGQLTKLGNGLLLISYALLPLFISGSGSMAMMPEPPNTFYGTVEMNGLPLTYGTVELILDGDVDPAASYELGSDPDGGNSYRLVVPLDAIDPRDPGTARPGDSGVIHVNGQSAATVVIGERGAYQALDLNITSPHSIEVTAGPYGLPNPVSSGGAADLFVEAADTLGHSLTFSWAALCPGLPGGGFDDTSSPTPIWTAPLNLTGDPQDCTLSVNISDGQGLDIEPSFVMTVDPGSAPSPVAVPQADPNPAFCNQEIAFDGSGSFHSNPERNIVSYQWDLDYDGINFDVDASGTAASHTYVDHVGPVTAALKVTDNGAPPLSAMELVGISAGESNRAPVADPGGPYGVNTTEGIVLDATGSHDPDAPCGDGIAAYHWDLDGDGQFDDTSGSLATLSWNDVLSVICQGQCSDGHNYPLRLQVTDNREGSADEGTYLSVSLDEPVAVASFDPDPALCGQETSFDGSASYHADPGLSIVTYEWDFDYNGVTFDVEATGDSASHTYNTMGTYTAALRITDDDSPPSSNIWTVEVNVAIDNQAPTSDPGGPYFILSGSDLTLDGSGSSDPDLPCGDSIAVYGWDLDGDGLFDDASGAVVILSWGQVESLVCGGPCQMNQMYPISLEVNDSLDASDQGNTDFSMTYILVSEDFSDGSKEGDPDWDEITGNFKVTGDANPKYTSVKKKNSRAVCNEPIASTFPAGMLEARLKLTKKFIDQPNGAIIFDYLNKKHYRYVSFIGSKTKKKRKVKIGQVGDYAGDTKGKKAQAVLRKLNFNEWHQIWVDIHPDGTVNVFFKDRATPVVSYRFPALANGQVGCWVKKAVSYFDDFICWEENILP